MEGLLHGIGLIYIINSTILPLNNWGQVDKQTIWCYSGLKWMQLKKLRLEIQPIDTRRQG